MIFRSQYRLQPILVPMLVVSGFFWAGCGDQVGGVFEDIVTHRTEVADFEDFELGGQERLVFTATVTADMIHPEFIADWTNLNSETSIDFYILRAADYDAELKPADLDNMFFTSAPDSGEVIIGERRVSDTHVHPTVGSWVLFFFNQAVAGNPANRSDLSANVNLVFRQ